MQTAGSAQDTTTPDHTTPPFLPAQKRDHESFAFPAHECSKSLLVCGLDVEHVDASLDDMLEVADIAVPSAHDPLEFFVLDETELDITATEEALDKLLWHEVVVGNAKSVLRAGSTSGRSGVKTCAALDRCQPPTG